MLQKLSTLLFAVPLISALTLNQPTTQVYSASPLSVSWTVASGDPANFDLYLTNAVFRNTFALKNQVTTSDQNITITLPVVQPGSGYTLQASPVGNVNQVLSQTSQFDIASTPSSSSSLATSSGTGSPSSLSGSSTVSSLGSTGSPNSTPLTSTSSSSSTVVPTGSFNGGNNSGGALTMTGIGATIVGVLVAAGAFFSL